MARQDGDVDLHETAATSGVTPAMMPNDSRHRSISRSSSNSRKNPVHSILDVRPPTERLRKSMMVTTKEPAASDEAYGSTAGVPEDGLKSNGEGLGYDMGRRHAAWFERAAHQIPAIALVALFHLMVGIPFGVSYFPVGWRAAEHDKGEQGGMDNDNIDGVFPLIGKESLGIRMFLFSTVIGQVVFTFASKFTDAIGLQMVENVPFCHSLAYIVINEQGYGLEAISTLNFLFGLASIIVGVVFYLLGRFELGRVVYFFPSHVLVGCIGGIGIFIAITGIEVTTNSAFSFNVKGIHNFAENFHLLGIVFLFEFVLRLLTHFTRDKYGKPRYPLLPPIYFCMITPVFYLALWIFRLDKNDAEEAGYFFPSLDACDSCSNQSALDSIFNEELFRIWRLINFSTISWVAVVKSIPTMVALVLFSLIHVPINIPAFAITTNVEADMNAELVAHGYSNTIAGVLGGLQNYMAYTQSVIYFKSGGKGRASSLSVALVTTALFVVGPTIASYMPRAMAGTLLLHFGIDLFLEGVYDSYGKYDYLEYTGIWLITIVMTAYGMAAALIAGVIAALSTYAFQSITYLNPIRGSMSAATLRSSLWNRSPEANKILDDDGTGRKKILVIQLQGHLFFGNVAQLTDSVKHLLTQKQGTEEEPFIVIMDFTLILGIDSSAAQAITKLKTAMHKSFNIDLCVFVTGSIEGFPCEYALSQELETSLLKSEGRKNRSPFGHDCDEEINETTLLLQEPCKRIGVNKSGYAALFRSPGPKSHVCNSLDSALIFSEDALVARKDPNLLNDELGSLKLDSFGAADDTSPLSEEREVALQLFVRLCPGEDLDEVQELFSLFEREIYAKNDVLWRQGSSSDCTKFLVHGTLMSLLENEAGTSEQVHCGNMIGEFSLVQGTNRTSTVKCLSEEAIVYSLSRTSWGQLIRGKPNLARLVYVIVVKYLSHRVQHVSNRIFETRCLPI